MKLALVFLMLPIAILSCEQHPLENLRKAHTMEELKRFTEEGQITMGMFNHVIAHDDIELLKLFYSESCGNKTEIVYKDYFLTQADRRGAPPVSFKPIHLAAQFGAEKVAVFCLENGASVNCVTTSIIPEWNNNTPAHIAALYDQFGVLAILATANRHQSRLAFLDIKNGLNQTPEEIAREKKNPLIIDMFNRLRAIKEKYAQEANQKPT